MTSLRLAGADAPTNYYEPSSLHNSTTVASALVKGQIRDDAGMVAESSSESSSTAPAPVVIRISPMAHFAVGFFALGLLAPVLAWPVTAPLLAIPILLSVMIERLRTVADAQSVTARTLLGSRTVGWVDVDGLRFVKSSWARAQLRNGEELRLPAVTFSTLPLLAEASQGRVPNPYA
jgi:Bacterial PH domain